jgi:hypothetical protein
MQKNGKHYQPAGLISVQESEIRTEKAHLSDEQAGKSAGDQLLRRWAFTFGTSP